MTMFRAAAVQLRSGLDPAANASAAETLIREAAARGASYVQTPEMTNIIDGKRDRLLATVEPEEVDGSLKHFRALAADLGIVLHIGSMAILLPGDKVANRAFVLGPDGAIVARYDKIHMYDADLGGGESYRESRLFQPGEDVVAVDLPEARLGLAICYDLRFPYLFADLARAGAQVLTAPAAFTQTTGQAHWQVLLRSRAIETGSYVIAAAQGGEHEDGRRTYGHSMIVDPWGEVLAEADEDPTVIVAEIDTAASDAARKRIPALQHRRRLKAAEVAGSIGIGEAV